MQLERIAGGSCRPPFPVYPQLAETLATAHAGAGAMRDATVAHLLGVSAAYAYADLDSVSMMMTRLGLEQHACVEVTQVVDAMFIFSTAYLVQSRCGRVVILSYRGTVPGSLGNWLGDIEIGTDSSVLSLDDGAECVRVHAGFLLNLRATWVPVIDELTAALAGRSILDHDRPVPHPAEALYVTGHSLGGAIAVLFALTVAGNSRFSAIADRLRAVYTFGQPMAVAGRLPLSAATLQPKVVRHVLNRDPVPRLPPASWGPFVHLGAEYRPVDGEWKQPDREVKQLASLRQIPRSVLAVLASERRRSSFRYTAAEHAPQQYLAALRPPGGLTEFGD